MLWDLIRDFFVEHIFGGYNSNGVNSPALVGWLYNHNDDEVIDWYTNDYYVINFENDGNTYSLSMGDWLSTTATIISITIIVVLCCLFVYKIVKLIGGLIR